MDATMIKILAMDVVTESNISKQEKLELLDFIKESEDLEIMGEVLESYGLLEDGEQNVGEENEENVEECMTPLSLKDLDEDEELEETLMGPLKTPRDEDIQETKMGPLKNPHDEDLLEKMFYPLLLRVLEKKGMSPAVVDFLKRGSVPRPMRIIQKLASSKPITQGKTVGNLNPVKPAPALP